MKKQDFIKHVAELSNETQASVGRVMVAIGAVLEDELHNEGEVLLPGIVKFSIKDKAARKGVNPKTGEPIEIAAKRVVKAKAVHPLSKVA